MKPNPLEVQKKIYGDMRKFAKESKLKKLRDAHHPMVHVSIATGTPAPMGHPLDGMQEEELEKLAGKKDTKKEEDDEE